MKRLFLLYKRNIILSSLVAILLCWAISATLMGLSKKDKTLLIRFTNEDVSIIDSLNRQEELLQERAFLRRFVMLMYNYDFLSFEENISKASFILSDTFWLKMQSEMKQSKTTIFEKKITQTSAIEKVVRVSPTEFEIITQTSISKEGLISDHKVKIKVSLNKTARTVQNPWGMEVSSAIEENLM